MADRQPAKFKAPTRAASPLVASKPLLIADAKQALEHVEKAERERVGEPTLKEAGRADSVADGPTEVARSRRGTPKARSGKPDSSPAPGTSMRIAVVPHLTAAAAEIYKSLSVPERDRVLWLANLVRADFADWSERALSHDGTRQLAASRLREPRRDYVAMQRLTFQTTSDRVAALRDAVADTLKVYPDAAVVGVWVAMQLEEELDAQARR